MLPLTFTQISVPQAFCSCFYLSRLAFNNWQILHDKLTGKGYLLHAVGEVSRLSWFVCNSANVMKMHSFFVNGGSQHPDETKVVSEKLYAPGCHSGQTK